MSDKNAIRELEVARRTSKKALPFYIVLALIGILFVYLVKLSIWQIAIVLFLTVGFLLGHIWNIIYCGRKLRTARNEKDII
jgi:hypothetical protein